MSEQVKKPSPTTAEGHGDALAKSIISSFAGALKKQAALSGGYLSKPDVDKLIAAFSGQVPRVAKKITTAINEFSETSIRDMWDPSRTSAFERVLVKQFSKMLNDDETVAHDHNFIARRSLPGIFMCVRMMAGPELLEVYEQDAFLVMQRVRDDKADNFSWDSVYADKRTVNMVRDLLMGIAPYFINIDKRIEWMLPIINSHLSPVDEASPVAEWEMDENMLKNLLGSMYSGMWPLLEGDTSRMHLTQRYGAESLETLDKLHKMLGATT